MERERRRREKEATIAQARRDQARAGVRMIDAPSMGSDAQPVGVLLDPLASDGEGNALVPFTPESHMAACEHHAAYLDWQGTAVHVCTDPGSAGHVRLVQVLRDGQWVWTTPSPDDDEQPDPEAEATAEAERQARKEREEALDVAAAVRRSFALTLVQPTRSDTLALARYVVSEFALQQIEYLDANLDQVRQWITLVGGTAPEGDNWAAARDALLDAIGRKRTVDALIGVLFAFRITSMEASLTSQYAWRDDDARRYLRCLIDHGYELSTIERELLLTGEEGGAATEEVNQPTSE